MPKYGCGIKHKTKHAYDHCGKKNMHKGKGWVSDVYDTVKKGYDYVKDLKPSRILDLPYIGAIASETPYLGSILKGAKSIGLGKKKR